MNDRTRSAVALEVDVAATRATRRRGLLGRESLGATEGLLLITVQGRAYGRHAISDRS
jgi:uncharacterized membrane protein (UPF0127 family)